MEYRREIIDEEDDQVEELLEVLDSVAPIFHYVKLGKELVMVNSGLDRFVGDPTEPVGRIIWAIMAGKNRLIETYRFLSTFTYIGNKSISSYIKNISNIKIFIEPYTLIHKLNQFRTNPILNIYKYKFIKVQQKIPFTDTPTFYLLNTPMYLSQEDVDEGITIIIKSPLAVARQLRKDRLTNTAIQSLLPNQGKRDLTYYASQFLEDPEGANGPITDLRQLKEGTTYLVRSSRFTIDASTEKFICTFDGVKTPAGVETPFTGGKHKRRVHKTKRNRGK